MDIPISAALFTVGGLLLLVFALRHVREYFRDPSNVVNTCYTISALSVSLALCFYGVPAMLSKNMTIVAIGGSVATVINLVGFGFLLLIPVYNWFGKGMIFLIARYVTGLFAVVIAAILIMLPPEPAIDPAGAIHWRFHLSTSLPALLFMVGAFGLNIVLLVRNWSRLKNISSFNLFALLFTFALTGLAGSYLYVGDTTVWLIISSVLMPIGLTAVFFSAVKGFVKKKN